MRKPTIQPRPQDFSLKKWVGSGAYQMGSWYSTFIPFTTTNIKQHERVWKIIRDCVDKLLNCWIKTGALKVHRQCKTISAQQTHKRFPFDGLLAWAEVENLIKQSFHSPFLSTRSSGYRQLCASLLFGYLSMTLYPTPIHGIIVNCYQHRASSSSW